MNTANQNNPCRKKGRDSKFPDVRESSNRICEKRNRLVTERMAPVYHLVVAIVLSMALTFSAAAQDASRTEARPESSLSFMMSLDDTFEITPHPGWTLDRGYYLTLRFGQVKIRDADGTFHLKLTFLCDTPDLAKFDSPDKMRRWLVDNYADAYEESLEKQTHVPLRVESFAPGGRYGFLIRLTDKHFADTPPPPGEWKMATFGIVRLSADSALAFELLTNSVDDSAYKSLLDYIGSFVKPEAK